MVMAMASSDSSELLLEPQGNARYRQDQAMITNAGTTHRPHGLPGPVAVSAAFAANAWAAVPPSRGSPPGRYPAGSGFLTAPQAVGTGEHAAAAREGRQS